MTKLIFSLFVLSTLSVFSIGCGGVAPGVADAPDKPAPELTPDERKSEAEAARNARK
jgi:hypothetical protein